MTIDVVTCECAAKGLPEGYICGKPDCPRVLWANARLRQIAEALFVPLPEEKKDVD